MNTKIKIDGTLSVEKSKNIIKKSEQIEGVISVKIYNSGILSYDISEWSSDYDVMVAIMNIIEQEGFDSEPLFDGGDEMVESVNSIKHDHHEHHEHEHCCCDHDHHEHEHCCCDHDHHEHEHCCCEDEHHGHHEHEHCHCDHDHHEGEGGVSFCGCGHHHVDEAETKKYLKSKIIELSASILVFIVGIILSVIPDTKTISDYVFVASFALAGYEVVVNGVMGIFKGKPFTEDTLMTIAAIAAMFLGETVEAVGIMVLYGVGSTFEHAVTSDANKIINTLKAYKLEKVRIIGDGGIEKTVSPEKVAVGDIMVIRAGEKLTVDGVIVEGSASFDTKVITGESTYKDLDVNSEVLSGYLLVNGTVKVKALKTYADSAISKIAKIVEESANKKSKPEKFLSKFAKWYTPSVVIVALLVAFIPPFFSSTYLLGLKTWGLRAVMLLCVSCPCSLVISIPLAYFMGVANCAKNGVIVKNSATLEKLSSCKTVVFDKTGTLTMGELSVTKIVATKKYQGKVLTLATACEIHSNHPIAHALKKKHGEIVGEVSNYNEIAGRGVSCVYEGQNLLLGNAKFLSENGIELPKIDYLGTKLYLAVNGEYAGVIILNDKIRKTARGAILELYDSGIENTVMLTGDNKDYAVSVRKELNMNKSVSELLPHDKVKELEEIINSSNKSTVAFVGDGVNDAPVITRADVGIAMGGVGSQAVVDSADVILTTDDLSKIPYVVKLAKRTSSIAKQNLIFSLLIKFAVMIISVFGISSSLWLAIGADVGLLIVTIFNSIRNKIKII